MAESKDSPLLTPCIAMFAEIEADMNIKIPGHLKRLLYICGYTNLYTLIDFDETDEKYLGEKLRLYRYNEDLTFPSYLVKDTNYQLPPAYKNLLKSISKYASKVKDLELTALHQKKHLKMEEAVKKLQAKQVASQIKKQ